jgi:hypothetical protein
MPSIKYYADLDLRSVSKIVNLPAPSASTDAASKGYVDTYIEGLAWKEEVAAASTADVDTASPGATLDGVTLTLGDRILLKDQTDNTENGIYIFDTSTTALVRSADASTMVELKQAVVTVAAGTVNEGVTFRQTEITGTLGSNPVLFVTFGTSVPTATETVEGKAEIATQAEVDAQTEAGAKFVTPATLAAASYLPHIYAADVGDGSSTSIAVTHSLGTKDVIVSLYDNTNPFGEVVVAIEHTSTSAITLQFDTAPTSNQFRCVVMG